MKATVPRMPPLLGDSGAIRHVREIVNRVAPTRLPVLVEGPTGSGKELVAAALHHESRREGAFVPFNMCAVSEGMSEDALFGHVRGAFTGAASDHIGYLEEANGGTLFLDEIGSAPVSIQAKLLRAIETQEYRPIGARRNKQSDFRVVAAINEDLDLLIGSGRLREDFAYRIGAVRILVPALRDRPDDIPVIAHYYATRAGASRLTSCALDVLRAHTWPGNVRELRSTVECAVAFSASGSVSRREIAAGMRIPRAGTRHSAVSRSEELHLRALLEQHDWDASEVAAVLGVHRATVYRQMGRLGVSRLRRAGTPVHRIDELATGSAVEQ